jgi:phosphoribosylformimino-5-aminoimidazole carboxamide ribotide isomerase
MIIIPAIDILNGKVARLTRGDFKFEKVYKGTAVEFAKKWESLGAEMIHVVDLDGAKTGEFKNLDLISQITSSVKSSIELGGGLRDKETINRALDAGIARVIIGTRAVDKNFVKGVIEEFDAQRVIVGVDAREGRIAVSGWTETKNISTLDFIAELERINVKTIVFTDILKDGTLIGPNVGCYKHECDIFRGDIFYR